MSLQVPPRSVSIGGPQVHRYLPYSKKRMVGSFIYFDYFPATDFAANQGIDVPPHPHIGLSTLSYLLEGEVLHHDSLGCRQILRPGDINWMTAGRGIAHSERQPEHIKGHPHRLHLLQFWVALPTAHEDDMPSFTHHPATTIPQFKINDVHVSLIAGSAFDYVSPVKTYSKMFFMDVKISTGQEFRFAPSSQEIAFLVLKGSIDFDNTRYTEKDFVVLDPGAPLHLIASQQSADLNHIIVFGGEALPEPRYIDWNFVSSSQEKIAHAKKTWMEGSFPQVPGENDKLPLPGGRV